MFGYVAIQSYVDDDASEGDLGDGPYGTQSRLSGVTGRTPDYDGDSSLVHRHNGLPRVFTCIGTLSQGRPTEKKRKTNVVI